MATEPMMTNTYDNMINSMLLGILHAMVSLAVVLGGGVLQIHLVKLG